MWFTKDWTKEDNDKYRSLIKERKSMDKITQIMGMEKLKKHPKGKFISNMSDFILNEIKYSIVNSIFNLEFTDSKVDNTKQNYHAKFTTKSKNDYVIDFIFIRDIIGPYKGQDCYNLSFTISNQHNLSDSGIYNKATDKNELHEIMSKLLFIVNKICDAFHIKILIVGLTVDETKNKIYLQMIQSMNKHYVLGESSINQGLDVYYINF